MLQDDDLGVQHQSRHITLHEAIGPFCEIRQIMANVDVVYNSLGVQVVVPH